MLLEEPINLNLEKVLINSSRIIYSSPLNIIDLKFSTKSKAIKTNNLQECKFIKK